MSADSPFKTELALHFATLPDASLTVSAAIVGGSPATEPVPFTLPPNRKAVLPDEKAVPLDEKALIDLRWYLELYPQWPVGPDYDRALGIEAKLQTWGKALFDAAFSTPKLFRVYEQFRLKDGGKSITIDATDPRVLQLPWELLADEGGYVFTQRPPINVRRKLRVAREPKAQAFTLPVRILMVISRPEGDHIGFLDPRSSAQALLDAIEPLGERVTVEFLYPPTLKALTTRVRDPRLPPVHVVHFDGHGVYRPETGLGYLLFENDDHQAQLVNAADLGTLLNDTGVPLMLLDACQTAQTDQANPFGSVASKLIEAGIGSVLAMNYSVLVSATRLLTEAFYGALAQSQTIGQAVDAARFAMLMDPERAKLYRDGKEEAIQLRDWFLPALYQQSLDPAPFTATPPLSQTGEAGRGFVPTYPARGGFPDEPRYGFHGRERELLHLRRTLAERPIVVVHGYGGQGKTTLAAHAARWFTRTHLFERAIFVSFERGGGLDFALSEMGAALLGDNFAIHQGDPVDAIAVALRDMPTLVVWDNFESILPNGDAYASDQELQKLLSAAARWFSPSPVGRGVPKGQGEGSRLIVTTRDSALPHPAFSPGRTAAHTELPGLGLSDALDLAAQVLKDNGIARPPREGLAELLIQLGGHPLSIQLVVPHLREYSPEKLIAEFDALLPGFTTGAGKERNESLRVSLDFSLRRLGDATRQLLPDLAVFQHGGMEAMILSVLEWKPSQWRQVRDELARAALLSIDQGAAVSIGTDEGQFGGYYVRFHPTLLPYLKEQLTPARRAELEVRYAQAYYQLASYEYHQDNKDPIPTRAIVMRELPNFRRALDLTLAAGDIDTAADFANSIAWFLNYFGRWSERDAMMAQVSKMQEARSGEAGDRTEYLMMIGQSERLLQMGRASEAEKVIRGLLLKLGDVLSYNHSRALEVLGKCLHAQGKQNVAKDVFQQELVVLAQLEQGHYVKRQTGIAHTDLADALAEMGQYDAARQEYEASLSIKKEIGGEERGIAVVLGQLGTLALRQNDLNEARRRYLEALAIFRNMGEAQMEAMSWGNLGRVAQEAEDWAEAERCYKECYVLFERIGDKAYVAVTCNNLALVAEGANRPDEAERWYLRAIEGFKATGQTRYDAAASSNLADLYLAQGKLAEAERYAQRAREIRETLDISAEIWKTHSILAQIAEQRGRPDEARQWRRKEQETYQAYVDRSGGQVIGRLEPVVQMVVAACNGDAQAKQMLDELLPQLESQPQLHDLAIALRRILAGERGDELEQGLGRAGSLVRRVLMLLASPSSQPSPSKGEGADTSPAQGEVDEPSGESGEGESGEGEGVSLQDILNLVIAGAQGNAQSGQQAYQITQALQQPGAPPEYRAIGRGLQNVLEGLRGDEAVAGLPPQVAQIVQMVLQQLA